MQNTLEPRPEGKDTHRGSGDCRHWIREAPWYLNWLDRFSTLFCWREVHFMPLPVQPAQTDPAGSWVGRVSSWRHRPRIRQVRWRQKIGAPLLCLQLLGSFHWRGYSWPWPGRVNECPAGRGQGRGPEQRGQPKPVVAWERDLEGEGTRRNDVES